MRSLFYRIYAKLTGKNAQNTPVAVILDQMRELRPLPLGKQEFDDFVARIKSSIPPLQGLTDESLRFTLATMILRLGPQDSHKDDLYFAKSIMKAGANEVAAAVIQELKSSQEALKKVEADAAATLARVNNAIKQ